MSEMGQTEKNSVRAYVFRFALELGHSSMQSDVSKVPTTEVAFSLDHPAASARDIGEIVRLSAVL
jgi:hypothetical protein